MKFENITNYLNKNKSTILTCAGVVFVVGSHVAHHYAAKKANKKLDVRKEDLGKDSLTVRETIETVAIDYIPTIALTGAGIGCVIASHKIDMKDIAAAAGALEFFKNRNKKMKDATEKVVGEETSKEIERQVATEEIHEKYPRGISRKIPEHKVLFYDPYLGQIIESDYPTIDGLFRKLSNKVQRNRTVYLEEFWRMMKEEGLIKYYPERLGESLSWDREEIMEYLGLGSEEDCVIPEYMPIDIDGIPCMEINYISEPQ